LRTKVAETATRRPELLDLRQEVARRFTVTVHERTIGTWLRQFRLTRRQPRPNHPKQDAAAEVAYQKTWPAR